MTLTSAPVRPTSAVGAQHADFSVRPASVHAGVFTRPVESESSSRSAHAGSLQTMADVFRGAVVEGAQFHIETFGKPAVLSGREGGMVLKSKYSTDPSEPCGLLGFKNGKVVFAKSGYPGVSLTPKQQVAMVEAALEALLSGDVRRS